MLHELLWWLPALLVVWFGVMLSSRSSSRQRQPQPREASLAPPPPCCAPGPLALTLSKMEGDPGGVAADAPADPLPPAPTANALPAKCCGSGDRAGGVAKTAVKTVRFALDPLGEDAVTVLEEDPDDDPWGRAPDSESASEDELDFAFSYQVNRLHQDDDEEEEEEDDEDDDEEDDEDGHEAKTDFSEGYDEVDFVSKLRDTTCSPPVADKAPRTPSQNMTFSTFGKAPLYGPTAASIAPPEGFRDRLCRATPPLPPKHVPPPMKRPPPPPPTLPQTLPPALPPKRPVPLPRVGGAQGDSRMLPPSVPPPLPPSAPPPLPPVPPPAPPSVSPPPLPPLPPPVAAQVPPSPPSTLPPALPPKGGPRTIPVKPDKGVLTPAVDPGNRLTGRPRIMGVVAKGKENTLKLKDLIARFDACNTHGRADRPLTKRASSTDSGIDVSPEPLVTQQDNVTLIQLVSSDSGASSSDEGGSASSASSGTRDSVLLLTHSGPSSWEDHPEPPRVDDKDSSPAVVERLVSFYQNAPDPATPTGTTPTPKMTLALGRQQLPNSAPWGMSRPRAPPPEPPPPASAPECAASIVKKVKEKFERLDQRPLEDTPSSTPLRRRGPSLDGFLGGARRRVIADPPAPAPPRRAVSDLSEIFFRAGVLEQLEAQRDERIAGHVVRLQARCRGFLARKQLAKRKVQDLAVRCIQRNVRKFMSVRDWPWWRLLVRVTPLLNVHRTEEELRAKSEELEALRSKVDKLEAERTQLKHESDRLEAKLSEMTVDLAEEHSTASMATDRLDVETADRIRLEKELHDVQGHNKRLQQTTERLELELLHARTADLNGVHSDDEGGSGDGDGPSAALRQRYERTLRELEFTKRRLQQQHEDDLEQLVGLKKQLEKKLADAYEEVEEQRQVVGQWKRKVQKLSAETSDLRLLLENQSSRNNLLEKKQRKFDSELQLLQDELRGERQQRERLSREKEIALGEKYSMEQNLSALRLELELKEEKVTSLSRELDELTFGGKTEEEVAQLKKAKHQLEHKCKDQQEELDDLAGQVQLLEQAKLRLEMSLEQLRKEHRKEISQRDDELEDVRSNAHKKVKALEARLEDEHEERTQLVRDKHECERRLGSLEEEWRARRTKDDGQVQRLRRDLKRTRALLTDAQAQLERAKADTPGKAALRGLRNQLEDLEMARAQAVKARQLAEQDLAEVQQQLEDAQRLRHDSEERANAANRERADLRTQLEENEDELAEVMNKYRAAVHQLSAEQATLQDSVARVLELEQENGSLQDQLAEMTQRLASAETLGDPSSSLTAKRLELRCKELESRLELEQTTRARLDTQISRLKETVDKLQSETSLLRAREQSAQDQARKLQRSLREVREEYTALGARDSEALEKRKALEKRLEAAEGEASSARADLKVALQRIDDLQQAIQGDLELDDDSSVSDNSDNDNDSEGSDESIETFLANHNMGSGRLSTANSSKRSSLCDRSPRQERTSMFDLSPRLGEACTPKEDM